MEDSHHFSSKRIYNIATKFFTFQFLQNWIEFLNYNKFEMNLDNPEQKK